MDFNDDLWNTQRNLSSREIFYNGLGRHLLNRVKHAQDHPTEQKIRMYDYTNPVHDHTIDNRGILRIFKQAQRDWKEAVRQDAPVERLNNIIHRAREALHREVWRVDRDMNSPVFKDDPDIPPYIIETEMENNWQRFDPDNWHQGILQHRPEAPWYRLNSDRTMDHLTRHGTENWPVHHRGFINHDYDILRIHDDGLKRYLMTPQNLHEIHENTMWKMTLLNYLATGDARIPPFNLRSYPHHRNQLQHRIVPLRLLEPENGIHFYNMYKHTRQTMDDPPHVPGDFEYEDEAQSDDGHMTGGSRPSAHIAMQSLESKQASRLERRIALANKRHWHMC